MTKQDIQNILALLNRVQINGTEAGEFIRLQQVLVEFSKGLDKSKE
jgi:hypothetical protein